MHDLGLHGMAKSFRDMADNPESVALGHAEWLGILLEHESTLRQQKRFESRAKTAKLRHTRPRLRMSITEHRVDLIARCS